jgi:hypothetical protein
MTRRSLTAVVVLGGVLWLASGARTSVAQTLPAPGSAPAASGPGTVSPKELVSPPTTPNKPIASDWQRTLGQIWTLDKARPAVVTARSAASHLGVVFSTDEVTYTPKNATAKQSIGWVLEYKGSDSDVESQLVRPLVNAVMEAWNLSDREIDIHVTKKSGPIPQPGGEQIQISMPASYCGGFGWCCGRTRICSYWCPQPVCPVPCNELVSDSRPTPILAYSLSAPLHTFALVRKERVPPAYEPVPTGISADQLYASGRRLYFEDNLKSARDHLAAAAQQEPRDARVWYFKALAERGLGDLDAAGKSAENGAALELVGLTGRVSIPAVLERVQGLERTFLEDFVSGPKALTVAAATEIVSRLKPGDRSVATNVAR